MKRLIALFLAGLTITSHAQSVDDYQPDSDGDGCIGMSDLLSLLSVFGSCEAQSFACGDPINYQGYDYATVLIGEQCWFAENLRSENYMNGDSIPAGLNSAEWSNTLTGAAAVYGEGSSTCYDFSPDGEACDEAWSLSEYGRLYNWYAVDDARGLCPSGWHVPTDGEWTVLTDHLGGAEVAGGHMKTTYGWQYGGNSTNLSGFSGLPGGSRNLNGYFLGGGYQVFWWSSSAAGGDAWARNLSTEDEIVYRDPRNPRQGFSVRCIQDSEE